MIKKVVDESGTERIDQEQSMSVEIVLDLEPQHQRRAVAHYPNASYPYTVIPPCFFTRGETEILDESSRRILTVETWDGRSVMSLERKR